MGIHIPAHIQTLQPYIPGKPIEETQREFKLKRVVKLASNENAMGASPKAVAAMKKGISDLHRYPDASGYALKKLIAQKWQATQETVILGNGSNEIMDLAVRTFCEPGDVVVSSATAFIAMKICAQIQGVTYVETPLVSNGHGTDWSFDLQAMLGAVKNQPKCRLVYLPNPNNPTGSYVGRTKLEAFLKALKADRPDVLVILDDAYWGFADAKDLGNANEMRKRWSNVLLLRTFSKVFGLAGVRVGVGIGPQASIEAMQRVRMPFNVSVLGLIGAEAALKDEAFLKKVQTVHFAEKNKWLTFFKDQGVVALPTQGNFFLVDVQSSLELSGQEVFQRMLKSGVILRPVTNYGLKDWIRISIGLPSENRFAMQVWKKEFPKKAL